MQYKVICEVSFPLLDSICDITIPINKSVEYVIRMINQLIIENINSSYQPKEQSLLINKKTGRVYDRNAIIKSTDIGNGTKLTFY